MGKSSRSVRKKQKNVSQASNKRANLNMSTEDFRNIKHTPVGERTDDPEALQIDESNRIFTQGLQLARNGNYAIGAMKIAQAFLLHEEGVKYFPIHSVSNFHDVGMDHGFLLKIAQQASVDDLVCKILHIIPGICHENCIQDNRCTQQNLMARAMKETESLVQMIENDPSIEIQQFGVFGTNFTRKKFLYFQGSIYSSIGNRDYADKCYTSALQIDPKYLKARRKRLFLWHNYKLETIDGTFKHMKAIVQQMHPDCVDLDPIYCELAFLVLKYPTLGTLSDVRYYFNKSMTALERKRKIYTHKEFLNTKVDIMRRLLAHDEFMTKRKKMDKNVAKGILPREIVSVKWEGFHFLSMYELEKASNRCFSCVRCRKLCTDPNVYGKCNYCLCVYFCGRKCFDADKNNHKPLCFAIQACRKSQEARFAQDQGVLDITNKHSYNIPVKPEKIKKSTSKEPAISEPPQDLDKDVNDRQELEQIPSDLQHSDESIRKEAPPVSKAKDAQSSIIQIQSVCRGMLERKLKLPKEVAHLAEFRHFYKSWGSCFDPAIHADSENCEWAALKEKQAFIRRQDILQDDDLKEADEKLNDAMTHAMESCTEDHDTDTNIETEEIEYKFGPTRDDESREIVRKIHLTADTEKWLRTCDSKYRDFFIRRIKQLASGDTSRILRKRLKGSTRTIYEVYLEQKSGFRILWTEEGDQVLIWYVAKHKNVSRLIKLIDDSRNRSDRTRVYIDDVEGLDDINASITKNNRDRKEILLDPLGNVPLKRYEVTLNNINKLSTVEWKSSLVLTEEERDVVETKGTVLLLGRSGTGKD